MYHLMEKQSREEHGQKLTKQEEAELKELLNWKEAEQFGGWLTPPEEARLKFLWEKKNSC